MPPMARRSLLQSGALAAVGLGLGTAWPGQGQARPATEPAAELPPRGGLLVAWVQLDPLRGGTVRLAARRTPAATPVELAIRDFPLPTRGSAASPGLLPEAARQAGDFARQTVARTWRVPGEGCRIEPGRIVCVADGRSVAYRVWVDVI
jgi:hypothetical protein